MINKININGVEHEIESNAIVDVNSVDELKGPTAVPESGMVNNVYFNTQLPLEETLAILDSLNFMQMDENMQIWACFADSTMESDIIAVLKGIYTTNYDYMILVMRNGAPVIDATYVFYWNSSNNVDSSNNYNENGWAKGFNGVVEFNIENQLSVVAPNINFTPENDKASQLFSVTPFGVSNEQVLYRVAQKGEWQEGTVVPNSGTVENIYLNTKLSVDEVVPILEKVWAEARMDDSPYVRLLFGTENGAKNMELYYLDFEDGPIWLLSRDVDGKFVNTDFFYFISKAYGVSEFTGWNPEFNGTIEINEELYNEVTFPTAGKTYVSVGAANHLMTKLMSTTPFEYIPSEEQPKLYHVKNKTVYEIGGNSSDTESGSTEELWEALDVLTYNDLEESYPQEEGNGGGSGSSGGDIELPLVATMTERSSNTFIFDKEFTEPGRYLLSIDFDHGLMSPEHLNLEFTIDKLLDYEHYVLRLQGESKLFSNCTGRSLLGFNSYRNNANEIAFVLYDLYDNMAETYFSEMYGSITAKIYKLPNYILKEGE